MTTNNFDGVDKEAHNIFQGSTRNKSFSPYGWQTSFWIFAIESWLKVFFHYKQAHDFPSFCIRTESLIATTSH